MLQPNFYRFFIILAALFLAGCSSDSDADDDRTSINPPQWIQGHWIIKDTGNSFLFLQDDVISYIGLIEHSFKAHVKALRDRGDNIRIEEEISDETYKAVINYADTLKRVEVDMIRIAKDTIVPEEAPYIKIYRVN